MPATVSADLLAAFADAWNRHDIESLMSFMHEDCVFETVAGPEAHGSRHVGREAVREAFAAAWRNVPDAQWRNGTHWVAGDRGVSESTFTGTNPDGTRIEANMVDLFVFATARSW